MPPLLRQQLLCHIEISDASKTDKLLYINRLEKDITLMDLPFNCIKTVPIDKFSYVSEDIAKLLRKTSVPCKLHSGCDSGFATKTETGHG